MHLASSSICSLSLHIEREQQIEGEEETNVSFTNYPKNPPIVITIDLCTITIMAYSAMNESWWYKLASTWRVILLNTTTKILNCCEATFVLLLSILHGDYA